MESWFVVYFLLVDTTYFADDGKTMVDDLLSRDEFKIKSTSHTSHLLCATPSLPRVGPLTIRWLLLRCVYNHGGRSLDRRIVSTVLPCALVSWWGVLFSIDSVWVYEGFVSEDGSKRFVARDPFIRSGLAQGLLVAFTFWHFNEHVGWNRISIVFRPPSVSLTYLCI